MDIPLIIHAANDSSNTKYESPDGSHLERFYPNYLEEKPAMAISYLVIICLAILLGTVGNIMVIGAVLIVKVGAERSCLSL